MNLFKDNYKCMLLIDFMRETEQIITTELFKNITKGLNTFFKLPSSNFQVDQNREITLQSD